MNEMFEFLKSIAPYLWDKIPFVSIICRQLYIGYKKETDFCNERTILYDKIQKLIEINWKQNNLIENNNDLVKAWVQLAQANNELLKQLTFIIEKRK